MKQVNNVFQFLRHITLHRKRVKALGLHFGRYAEDQKTLNKVLALHDIEKYIFFPWLWKYYGDGNKPEAREIYDLMNKVGEVIVLFSFLKEDKYWLKWVQSVEKICDVVDRHCDPVTMEEFNLHTQRDITDFLSKEELLAATGLITVYSELTKGLGYHD